MAGRTVTIPLEIKSVYSISPMGAVMMYTLAPSKITGLVYMPDDEEKALLLNAFVKKPVLGGLFGKNTTANPEVIIKAHPDFVLSVGNLEKTDISGAERIHEQLGIPVVMVNGNLKLIDSAYRFLGGLIGEVDRADTLARYCRAVLNQTDSIVAAIPSEKKVRIYYAEGLDGLQTDSKGSMHTEILDRAGGINVADIPLLQGYGRSAVSFEQLLVWQPAIIIVCLDHGYAHGTENFARITSDPSWHMITAVKNGSVYQIPSLPFNWIDRPPSVNRIIGLRWLTNLLYPDYCKIAIRDETRRFYALFYRRKLSDEELNHVLMNAVRKP